MSSKSPRPSGKGGSPSNANTNKPSGLQSPPIFQNMRKLFSGSPSSSTQLSIGSLNELANTEPWLEDSPRLPGFISERLKNLETKKAELTRLRTSDLFDKNTEEGKLKQAVKNNHNGSKDAEIKKINASISTYQKRLDSYDRILKPVNDEMVLLKYVQKRIAILPDKGGPGAYKCKKQELLAELLGRIPEEEQLFVFVNPLRPEEAYRNLRAHVKDDFILKITYEYVLLSSMN